MSTTFFAFTPNGYLYNSPVARTQSTLPDAIALRLENSQPKVAEVYHAAFADNGAYFLSYLAAEAGKYQFFGIEHRGLSVSLLDWIGQYPNFKRDVPSLQVVFGPYGQYFAWDKHGHHPGALLPVVAHSIQQDGGATANPPRIVALGPGGSYLIVKSRGEYYYDLLGCSKEADKWLDQLCQIETYPQGRPGALNELLDFSISTTKPGNFHSIWQNGTTVAAVSQEWHKMLESTTSAIKEYLQTVFPPPAYASPIPQKPGALISTAEIRPSPVSAVSSHSLHSQSPSLVAPQPVHPSQLAGQTSVQKPPIQLPSSPLHQSSQSPGQNSIAEMQGGHQPQNSTPASAEMQSQIHNTQPVQHQLHNVPLQHSPSPHPSQAGSLPQVQHQTQNLPSQQSPTPHPSQAGSLSQIQHQAHNSIQSPSHVAHPSHTQQHSQAPPPQQQHQYTPQPQLQHQAYNSIQQHSQTAYPSQAQHQPQIPFQQQNQTLQQPQVQHQTQVQHQPQVRPQSTQIQQSQISRPGQQTHDPAVHTCTWTPPPQGPQAAGSVVSHHAHTPSLSGVSIASQQQQQILHQQQQIAHSAAPQRPQVQHAPSVAPSTQSVETTLTSTSSGSGGKSSAKLKKFWKGAVKVGKDIYNTQTQTQNNGSSSQHQNHQQQSNQHQPQTPGQQVATLQHTPALQQGQVTSQVQAGHTVQAQPQQIQYIQRIVQTPQGQQVQYVQVQQPIRPQSVAPGVQTGQMHPNAQNLLGTQQQGQVIQQQNNVVQQQQTQIVQQAPQAATPQPGQLTQQPIQTIQQRPPTQTQSGVPVQQMSTGQQATQPQSQSQPIIQVQQQAIQNAASTTTPQPQAASMHPQSTGPGSNVSIGKVEPTINFSPSFNFGGDEERGGRQGGQNHNHNHQQNPNQQQYQQQQQYQHPYYQQQPLIYEQPVIYEQPLVVQPGGEVVVVENGGFAGGETVIVQDTAGFAGGETVIVQDNGMSGGFVTQTDVGVVTDGMGQMGLIDTQPSGYVYADGGAGVAVVDTTGTQQMALVDGGWSDGTMMVATDPSGVMYDYTTTTTDVTALPGGGTDVLYQQTEIIGDGSGDVFVQQDTLDVQTDAAGNVSFEETETAGWLDGGEDDGGDFEF